MAHTYEQRARSLIERFVIARAPRTTTRMTMAQVDEETDLLIAEGKRIFERVQSEYPDVENNSADEVDKL